jgi:hypothetical protein
MPNTDKKSETFETKILFLFLFQKLETKKDSLFLLGDISSFIFYVKTKKIKYLKH